ncbi:serine/threonine kinase [Pyrus ussuriensis x Pyrus communis]|uniref:Serine/threonine kinase n=1 Tax=Pyrus ussuriensis x Pyrus communis TaxID=2448454 RepID=A0A5N5GW90_9ROSA|nr:serine/threonine kinase [Pyrus ussuriensis x Pyrus communis]
MTSPLLAEFMAAKDVVYSQVLQTFSERKMSFSGHATTKVTHRLARLSLFRDNSVTSFEEPLDVIINLLFEDSN